MAAPPPPPPPRARTGSASPSSTTRGGKTTLCAGCGHNAISERILEAYFDLGIPPERVAKFSGIGCSSKTPGLLPEPLATPSTPCTAACRRWPPARCSPTGTCSALGRLRRRRHRLHRHRPVRPPDAAQPAHGLRGREQRRLRPHQGAVLGHRRHGLDPQGRRGRTTCRPSTPARWPSSSAPPSWAAASPATRSSSRRMLKAALVHRGTALLDVHLPLRHLQRPRGLDQELRLPEGARRAAPGALLRPGLRGHRRGLRPGHHRRGDGCTTGRASGSRKLEADYDPSEPVPAPWPGSWSRRGGGDVLTGVLFVDPDAPDFLTRLGTVDAPLATLPAEAVRPPRAGARRGQRVAAVASLQLHLVHEEDLVLAGPDPLQQLRPAAPRRGRWRRRPPAPPRRRCSAPPRR